MASRQDSSPLVQRLLAMIDGCNDLEQRAVYAAELACYWARTGEFERSDELRVMLRRSFEDGHNARVSILIMCIEALLLFYRELSPSARDRMARARALSSGVRDRKLIAFTSAWMAHIDFTENRFESMVDAIRDCLAALGTEDHHAECRISLVLGDAHLYCRLPKQSDAWYARARKAATELGDHAAIGALTYNRAALNVSNARLDIVDFQPSTCDFSLLEAEVQTAFNYQQLASLRSLDHLLHSAAVGVWILQRRFAEALPVTQNLLKSNELVTGSGEELLLQADEALCLAKIGQLDVALSRLAALADDAIDRTSPDDRAQILFSLSETGRTCGLPMDEREFSIRAANAITEHNETISRLKTLLIPYTSS